MATKPSDIQAVVTAINQLTQAVHELRLHLAGTPIPVGKSGGAEKAVRKDARKPRSPKR